MVELDLSTLTIMIVMLFGDLSQMELKINEILTISISPLHSY